MRISQAILALTLLIPGSVAAQPMTETNMPEIIYPETKGIPVIEEHFGHTIVDPYRWLENPVSSDEQVAQWVEAQNALTQDYLSGLPGCAVFAERMAALLNYEQVSAPVKRGERYFYTRNSGQENQPTLYMREGHDGAAEPIIDPNGWSEDSGDALGEWAPSDDGRFMAYGVQQGGTDWRTIQVLDIDAGTVLEDKVEWARFTDIAWAPDGSGFFYARFPQPDSARAAAGIANHAVYFHAIGTPQTQDRLIYTNPEHPENLTPIGRTSDGRYLTISPTPGAGANMLAVIDLQSEDWTPRFLVGQLGAEWGVIDNVDTLIYATTNLDAERGKVVTFDMAEAQSQARNLVAEDDAVLNHAALMGGRLVTAYLVDAKTEVRRFTLDGAPDGVVELPDIGSAGGFKGRSADNEAFFIFSTFDTPITVYRYDVANNTYQPWAEPKLAANFDDVVVEQRFYSSKDGTRVPLFIVRRNDVTEPAPTLLYGYGGFGISMVPVYNPMQMAWVEQGGVLAIANIRGGGEYGRAWHQAGQFENRQNAYDDFIAAGDYLKAENITSEDGLVVQGESNGGLLVGVVTNQRPDLFAAALPGVGVMDMLRYHQFTGGALWIADFGSPEEDKHFNNLLAYSPYHNIRSGADYPAILATTADADDRVVPAHTFKYTAALQSTDLGDRPRLVRIETRAGHGAGMPLDKLIALYADQWTFAAHWAGLEVGPAPERIMPTTIPALDGVVSPSIEMEAPGPLGALNGTLTRAADPNAPVVLIIPGSGPTDKDGNSPLGISAAPYRLLAGELAANGVSSVRIDKRGMFASAGAVADPNDVTIADYVDDTHAWIGAIRDATGTDCVWLLGHSEGGLVTLAAAQQERSICGIILVAAPGRPLGNVIKEQLRRDPANAPYLLQADTAIDSLAAGKRVDTTGLPAPLASLFAPAVQGFLINALSFDPAKLATGITTPILIIQGDSDLQVSMRDAELLNAAAPEAKLVRLTHVNHVLKVAVPGDAAANLATYADPTLSLAPGVTKTIIEFIHSHAGRPDNR